MIVVRMSEDLRDSLTIYGWLKVKPLSEWQEGDWKEALMIDGAYREHESLERLNEELGHRSFSGKETPTQESSAKEQGSGTLVDNTTPEVVKIESL